MKEYNYEILKGIDKEKIIINKLIDETNKRNILSKLKPIERLVNDLYDEKVINLLCIHHNDLDGYGVYMVIRLLEKLYPTLHVVYREEKTKVTKKSLTIEIAHFFDYVIIGDLSFDNEFTTEELETFEVMGNVALLDHHDTAINLNKYNFCNVIPHDMEMNKDLLWTGTSLMWIHFRDCIKDKFEYYVVYKNNQFVHLVNLIAMYDTYYWKNNSSDPYISTLSDMAYKLNILFKNADNKYKFIDILVNRIITIKEDNKFILTERDIEDAELLENVIDNEINYYLDRVQVASLYSIDYMKIINIGYIYYGGKYGSELGNRVCTEKDLDVCIMIDMYDKMKFQIRSTKYDCIKLFSHLKDKLGEANFGGHPFACGANNLRSKLEGYDIGSINKFLEKKIK